MKNMTQGNVTKLIMAFAIPVLLGNVFQQFYTMADTMMVGQILGVNSLAAIGASASLSNLVIGLCTGVSMGVSIMIAQYYGARDEEGMKKATAGCIKLCMISVVVIDPKKQKQYRGYIQALEALELRFQNAAGAQEMDTAEHLSCAVMD